MSFGLVWQRKESAGVTFRATVPPAANEGRRQPPRFRIAPIWVIVALVLLGVNYWIGSQATQGPTRIRVPYSPFFLQQVREGNVSEITSVGTAIQGSFRKATSYKDSSAATRFDTEVPAFADTNALSRTLQSNDVVVNAEPLSTGTPWWESLLVGFGPTILFLGLLFLLLRRAGNMQNALGAFGRSRARRYQPAGDGVTFRDVAGIDEAKEELTEIVDFLRQPQKYQRLGGRIPAWGPALRPAGHRQDAARAGGRRRGQGALLLAGRIGVRRGVRGRRRGPRTRPLRAGEGGRSRRSSSSTSSTPSAGRAPPGSPALAAATMSASRR